MKKQTAGVPHVSEAWRRIATRLSAAKRLLLCLDFDGTLTPLRDKPWDVWLEQHSRKVLRRLARNSRFKVLVVSGRMRSDLKERIGLRNIEYLGLHGAEDGSRDDASQAELRRKLHSIWLQLQEQLRPTPTVWAKNKGLALAIHYRGASNGSVRKASRSLRDVIKRHGSSLRLQPGKKVWEIVSKKNAGKGAAIRRVMALMPGKTVCIFIGDDQSDERAFAELPRAVTIRVGGPLRTNAKFHLRSPDEVIHFLEMLDQSVRAPSHAAPAHHKNGHRPGR